MWKPVPLEQGKSKHLCLHINKSCAVQTIITSLKYNRIDVQPICTAIYLNRNPGNPTTQLNYKLLHTTSPKNPSVTANAASTSKHPMTNTVFLLKPVACCTRSMPRLTTGARAKAMSARAHLVT